MGYLSAISPSGTYSDNERVHSQLWVVCILFRESRINDIIDTVDSDTRLSDVGSDHDLSRARRGWIEDSRLHLGW